MYRAGAEVGGGNGGGGDEAIPLSCTPTRCLSPRQACVSSIPCHVPRNQRDWHLRTGAREHLVMIIILLIIMIIIMIITCVYNIIHYTIMTPV